MELTIGVVIGILIGAILFHRRPVGNLRVDHSDPTGAPYLFLELGTDIGTVMRKKYVTFKVRIIVSMALTLVAFFAYCQIKVIAVVWYMVVAAVVLGFLVAYAAMFGFDKLKEALAQINKQ